MKLQDLKPGDVVEMERQPVYEHTDAAPRYKVTKRKVKSVKHSTDAWGHPRVIVRFVGMSHRYSGNRIDKAFNLSCSNRGDGWHMFGSWPRPSRYDILSVNGDPHLGCTSVKRRATKRKR